MKNAIKILAVALLAQALTALCFGAVSPVQSVRIQYFDSETGYRVQPASTVLPAGEDDSREEQPAISNLADPTRLQLAAGKYRLRVSSPQYRAMVADLAVADGIESPPIRIWLDPLEAPLELTPGYIRSLRAPDAMIITGVVVDDRSGAPLQGVHVSSGSVADEPDALPAETWTDARGIFQMQVPVPDAAHFDAPSTTLIFARGGYVTQSYARVQVWRGGDWTYRVRLTLSTAGAQTVIDEVPHSTETNGEIQSPRSDPVQQSIGNSAPVDAPTVRVPRTIRVLSPDGSTIDYVSLEYYCRRVLPAEWIASWAAYPGGSHALNGGSVAVRTYAVGAINKPKTSTYDICGTTACQVYGPATSTSTDAAVSETAQYVLVGGSGIVALTEYSAENNSMGFDCGDTFAAPTDGCLYDPVCAGETRSGHGRGLCQWGSAKWATGLKFPGNSTRDHATLNGFPRRDWFWILEHYYPSFQLVKGAALMVGDEVTARTGLNVRACAGGGISGGTSCPALAAEAAGASGVIVGGPSQNSADGTGYTWYQVRWPDVTGWSVENYLERVVLPPGAPIQFVIRGTSTNRIDLGWAPSDNLQAGFSIERAPGLTGPWTQLAVTGPTTVSFSDTNLFPASTWVYRVQAYNAAGVSEYSKPITAYALGIAPGLQPIPDQIAFEGMPWTTSVSASAPDFVQVITDFENYSSQSANGAVLFRNPRSAAATSPFLADVPDLSILSDVFPPGPNTGSRALQVGCAFGAAHGAWLRLTTAGASTLPNPLINLAAGLRFDIYVDRPMSVALGVRETATAAGEAMGSDGGTDGTVKWAGISGVISGQPQPTRSLPANKWTTCTFFFPNEPVRTLAGTESLLSSPSGLGVLEHMALVPQGGPGTYTAYLDNCAVVTPKTLVYRLAPGAPAGANIDPATGAITWTPAAQDAGRTHSITVQAVDNAQPPLSVSRTFQITVTGRPMVRVSVVGSQVTLSWATAQGLKYRVQVKDALQEAAWTDLGTSLTAAGPTLSFIDTLRARQRFYRVLLIN